MLVCLRVDVGRHRRSTSTIGLSISQKLKPCLDMRVAGVQLSGALIGVQSIIDLVVAALVECAEIIPYFGDERVQTNRPRICIQSISVLVDLIIEHTD